MRGHSAPEAALVKQGDKFMTERGWRVVKHESGFVPGSGSVGTKGMPDRQYIRYLETPAVALLVWVEWKQPGYKPRCNCKPATVSEKGRKVKGHECRSCGQKRWQAAERARGALVIQMDDLDEFAEWYAAKFGWLPVPPRPQGELDLVASGVDS